VRKQATADTTRAHPDHIEQVLTIIDAVSVQVRASDWQVKKIARA
jgi:hypothetical protein